MLNKRQTVDPQNAIKPARTTGGGSTSISSKLNRVPTSGIGPSTDTTADRIPTAGEELPEGALLELLRGKSELELLLWNRSLVKVAPRIAHGRKIYIPLNLDESIIQNPSPPARGSGIWEHARVARCSRQCFRRSGVLNRSFGCAARPVRACHLGG